MTYNETEIRFYLIDPILREKGYDDHQWLKLETPAPVGAHRFQGQAPLHRPGQSPGSLAGKII